MKYVVKTKEIVTIERIVDNIVYADSVDEAIEAFNDGDIEDYDIIEEDVQDYDLQEILEVEPI